MKNNKGYTLVELLVAIAIIGVVASVTVVGSKMARSANVANAANVVNSYMASIRMNNMSKVTMQYLHIYRYKDMDYYSIDNNKSIDFSDLENPIGNADSVIFYQTSGESTITNNNGITISYNRAGECKIYNKSGTLISDDLRSLTFASSRKTVIVRVLPAIGKSYID